MSKYGGPILWSIDAYKRTASEAVAEFAGTYWGAPRKPTRIEPDGSFHVRGGVFTYYVWLSDRNPPAQWIIERQPETAKG